MESIITVLTVVQRWMRWKEMRLRVGDKLRDYEIEHREHAHWIDDGGRLLVVLKYKCSNCGNRSAEKSNYCSFCGARMDEHEKIKH